MPLLVTNVVIGIILAILAKTRKYPIWETLLWFVAGSALNVGSAPLFAWRIIIEKKGWSIGLVSGALVAFGALSFLNDIGRTLLGEGLGAASVDGVLLIIGGVLVTFLPGKKPRSLEDRLSEIDNLFWKGMITVEEHSELRKSVLISQ